MIFIIIDDESLMQNWIDCQFKKCKTGQIVHGASGYDSYDDDDEESV